MDARSKWRVCYSAVRGVLRKVLLMGGAAGDALKVAALATLEYCFGAELPRLALEASRR